MIFVLIYYFADYSGVTETIWRVFGQIHISIPSYIYSFLFILIYKILTIEIGNGTGKNTQRIMKGALL